MNEHGGAGRRVWTRPGTVRHRRRTRTPCASSMAGPPVVRRCSWPSPTASAQPRSPVSWPALVEAATPRWLDGDLLAGVDAVRDRFDPLTTAGDDVDFVLEDLWRERGSAATLLIAEIAGSADRTSIRAAAVGDSVVLVSDQHSVTSFPLAATVEFSSETETVGTSRRDVVVQRWAKDLSPGSQVAIGSDGIGVWMLGLAERAGAVTLFDWLREVDEGALPEVDDDLTLVLISVPDRQSRWRRFVRSLTDR